MARDADKVVFVGVPDLARLTGKTRQRFSQLLRQPQNPDSVLPVPYATVNGNPVWSFDSVRRSLAAAGYVLSTAVADELDTERAVPVGTVPVGTHEVAEILGGIPVSTVRSRVQDKVIARHLFTLARGMVWDLDELIADAKARGFNVDAGAASKWRVRNGGGHTPARREVAVAVKVIVNVSAGDEDSATQQARDLVSDALRAASEISNERMIVVAVEAGLAR